MWSFPSTFLNSQNYCKLLKNWMCYCAYLEVSTHQKVSSSFSLQNWACGWMMLEEVLSTHLWGEAKPSTLRFSFLCYSTFGPYRINPYYNRCTCWKERQKRRGKERANKLQLWRTWFHFKNKTTKVTDKRSQMTHEIQDELQELKGHSKTDWKI